MNNRSREYLLFFYYLNEYAAISPLQLVKATENDKIKTPEGQVFNINNIYQNTFLGN